MFTPTYSKYDGRMLCRCFCSLIEITWEQPAIDSQCSAFCWMNQQTQPKKYLLLVYACLAHVYVIIIEMVWPINKPSWSTAGYFHVSITTIRACITNLYAQHRRMIRFKTNLANSFTWHIMCASVRVRVISDRLLCSNCSLHSAPSFCPVSYNRQNWSGMSFSIYHIVRLVFSDGNLCTR